MRVRGATLRAGLSGAVLALAATAASAATPTLTSTPTLAQLAARYEAWRGGPAFEALTSIQVAMTAPASNGQVWDETMRAARGGWMRFDIGPRGPLLTLVATPFTTWRRCSNCTGGFGLSEDAIRTLALVQSLDLPGALEPSAGRPVALKGIERWNGAEWAVAHIGGAQGVDVFIQPATGRLGGYRFMAEQGLVTTRYADWRWARGVRFAYVQTVRTGNTAPTSLRVRGVELGGAEDVSVYARPADVEAASFQPGSTSTGWLPLTPGYRREPILSIELDGKPAYALLDSGSFTTILGRDQLPAAGLKAAGAMRIDGASTGFATQTVRGGDIRIGALALRDPLMATEDPDAMHALGAGARDRPVIILGQDAFRGLIVDLDLPNQRVAFRTATDAAPPPGAIELPLAPNTWPYVIPITLEDGAPGKFIVDTGYYGALALSPALAHARNLPGDRPISGMKLQEVGGSAAVTITSLRRIAIGGVSLKDAPAELFPSWKLGDQVDGLVGRTVLERFRVIFDVDHNRLWLVPSPGQVEAPFWHAHLGIAFKADANGARITGVYPRSPAEAAGLKPGDVIAQVDGEPASADKVKAAAASPSGTRLRLTLADGSEREVTISDFY